MSVWPMRTGAMCFTSAIHNLSGYLRKPIRARAAFRRAQRYHFKLPE
jgi:hypothetical protein